jgi:hypothetical protein
VVAKQALGWEKVRVVMDDFHNCHAATYGRYDLVMAHGVYYHSIAPFLLLENVCSLSDAIFVGGFCATDALPAWDWLTLEHDGRSYRAKKYHEVEHFMAGVNSYGYFFAPEDLLRFFHERGFETRILAAPKLATPTDCYLRFLARKA